MPKVDSTDGIVDQPGAHVSLAQLDHQPGGHCRTTRPARRCRALLDPAVRSPGRRLVWINGGRSRRGINVGWRFISLRIVSTKTRNSRKRLWCPTSGVGASTESAPRRGRYWNDAVGDLDRAWGENFRYDLCGSAEVSERVASAGRAMIEQL